uniref:Uncharacterized protein n=1 Tax=Desulfovibrio sp. U5L TaxID=596152 RepID=I2Q694_9BACT
MQEATLRRQHRKLGLVLAVFLALQAATGLWLSLEDLVEAPPPATQAAAPEEDSVLAILHTGGGKAGNLYRLALGAAVLAQVGLGGLISLKIRARAKRS